MGRRFPAGSCTLGALCSVLDTAWATHPVFAPAVRSTQRGRHAAAMRALATNTRVSRYQKRKTYLDFAEARDGEWQWHQLGCMQVCRSLQTDSRTSSAPLNCVATLLVIV